MTSFTPHTPLSRFPQRSPSFPSDTHRKFSGCLGKGDQVKTFRRLLLDIPAQLLWPRWPTLQLEEA